MTAIEQKAKNFTEAYYRYAYRAGAKYGYNPLFLLAQSAFESGWGNETHTKAKAFAGIMGTKGWKGASFTTSDGRTFRQYPTFWAGFQDHADLFYNNAMKKGFYLPVHHALQGNSIEIFANAVAQSPYISEGMGDNRGVYESSIISCYNQIKEYKPLISFIDLQSLLALAICGGVGYGWYKLQTNN